MELLRQNPAFVEIEAGEGYELDLRYATTNNFIGKNLYGDFDRAFLHTEAKAKLDHALELLQATPGKERWKFKIFDALRPRSVQHTLWDNTPTHQKQYVADPVGFGSKHNYGFAVDIGLVDENGDEVDMGTGFDAFNRLSHTDNEEELVKHGKLTPQQVENRQLLRRVMVQSGFHTIRTEWWHFDALSMDQIRAGHYEIVE